MAKIVVDGNYCKSCGLCMEACPFKLISWSTESGEMGLFAEQKDATKCTGCRLCAIMCPDGAISVYK